VKTTEESEEGKILFEAFLIGRKMVLIHGRYVTEAGRGVH